MSEKILALIFRLYPTAFRERYSHEALLLYRDRSRYETGIRRQALLACDLLVDFFAGLPTAWQTSYSVVITPSLAADMEQVPSFRSLHMDPLRPASILLGSMFSLTAFGIFVLVLRTTALYPIERHAISPIDRVLQRLNRPALMPPLISNPQRAVGDVPASADTLQLVRPQGTDSTSVRLRSAINAVAQSPIALGRAAPAASTQGNGAASQGQAVPQDATQAMIQATSAHQVVMFGETHGNKQEYEWLCKLVKTPEFADRVDDIVVEFGNSLYQKTVDRYISGEEVPQARIEKAWRNVIGAVGPVSPVYGEFYKAVRESNLARRGGHQIRLLLGDPYGDWDKINDAEDLGPFLAHRDDWYAEVVKEEVLAHHHRALLIMGAGHFLRRHGPGLVEQAIRAAGVQPYLVVFGTNAVGGYDDLNHRFDAWTLPAIVALYGNWVGDLPANPVLTGGNVAPNSQKMEDVADALLYVGSRDTLTQVFVPKSELVDTAYGKEVERRLLIQTGRTMDFTEASEGPQYQRPPQQTVSNGIHRLPPKPPKSVNDPLPPRPPLQ